MFTPRTAAPNDFRILIPDVSDVRIVNSQNKTLVRVQENTPGDFMSYEAVVDDIAPTSSSLVTVLTAVPGIPGRFEDLVTVNGAPVPAGIPLGIPINNKRVFVTGIAFPASGVINLTHRNDFYAHTAGSGSGSEAPPGPVLASRQQYQQLFQSGLLVPARLAVKLEGPVKDPVSASCDRLKEPIVVVYANDPHLAGYWLSHPFRMTDDHPSAAFLHLRKTDPRTWRLRLRWKNEDVVSYHAQVPDRDASFPLAVTIERVPGLDRSGWPKRALILPH